MDKVKKWTEDKLYAYGLSMVIVGMVIGFTICLMFWMANTK